MRINKNSIHRLLTTTRILRVTSLKNVLMVVILQLVLLYLIMSSLSNQCSTTDNQVSKYKQLRYVKTMKSGSAIPAMVPHPDVAVVTSGNADLETGETVMAYFYWCGKNVFRFRNYLSVLSAIYVIKPSKIVFLYTHEIVIDDHRYHTWFQALLTSVPNLVTMDIGTSHNCDIDVSEKLLRFFPDSDETSIFIGLNTIMADFPLQLRKSPSVQGSAQAGRNGGFLFMRRQHGRVSKPDVRKCVSESIFDPANGDICIILDSDLVPKDLWTLDTPFGTFVRNLVYRHPDPIRPHHDFSTLVPRIAHFFWFGAKQFSYGNYLSVLSALYVAGLERVYFHGVKPRSHLFDKLLQEENVTHIHMPEHKYIHNHRLRYTTHNADIGKLYVLSKYGGVSQDGDVFWTQRISDEILAYDAVVGFDWPEHGEFPEVFNLGVLIGKQDSFYFKALLNAMKDYQDDTVHHLAMRLPYKTYEQYPASLYTSRHLQVICWLGKCHPSWLPNYIQPLALETPGMDFNWKRDTYSVHCTWPKPPTEMNDFETLKTAKGLFAEIGRNILRKAGKL